MTIKFTPEIVAKLETALANLTSDDAKNARRKAADVEFSRLYDLDGYSSKAAYESSRIAGGLASDQVCSLLNTIKEAKRQIELDNDIAVSLALIDIPEPDAEPVEHEFIVGDEVVLINMTTPSYDGVFKVGNWSVIYSIDDGHATLGNEYGHTRHPWIKLSDLALSKAA